LFARRRAAKIAERSESHRRLTKSNMSEQGQQRDNSLFPHCFPLKPLTRRGNNRETQEAQNTEPCHQKQTSSHQNRRAVMKTKSLLTLKVIILILVLASAS